MRSRGRVTGCTSASRARAAPAAETRIGPSAAVRGIADERMAERGEMHADLVRAAGLEPAAQQRRVAEALEDVDVRARRLARGDDRHRRALGRMAADRRVDRVAAREVARGEREVLARHRARLQLAHEVGVRRQRLRDDQEAARVLVEPMHDAGARHARELRRVMQQRVEQRAVAVAGARMHDEPGRLVDDEERVVLGNDRQRDRLGQTTPISCGSDAACTTTRSPPRTCPRRRRGDGRPASRGRRRSSLEAAARELRQRARERLVEALARGIRRQRRAHARRSRRGDVRRDGGGAA